VTHPPRDRRADSAREAAVKLVAVAVAALLVAVVGLAAICKIESDHGGSNLPRRARRREPQPRRRYLQEPPPAQRAGRCRPYPVMTTSEGAPRAAAPPGEDDAGGEDALWAAARADDRQAFTELYHRHADAVWRHAHRLTSSPTVAEDVLAATFLTTWRRRGEVQIVGNSLRPWLLAVAGNEARTERRRMHRRYRLFRRVGPEPPAVDHSDAVVASLDDRRRVNRVLAAIDALPTKQREAVALCLVAEVPYVEAARVLGVSEPTLRSRVHRARTTLRSVLPEEVR
jgi:RNA polymerase sigma factor (sigma-70 family)